MKYITGMYALNLNCSLDTMGDWHYGCYKWNDIDKKLHNSEDSIFKDYGIEINTSVFENKNKRYFVANHIRACLDILEQGKFGSIQGMNKDFIGNSKYDNEIFNKVLLLKNNSNWENINKFMINEYGIKWIRFIKGVEKNEYK